MTFSQKRDLAFCVLALSVALAFGGAALRYQIASAYFPLMLTVFIASMATILLLRTIKVPQAEKSDADVSGQLASFAKVLGASLAYVLVIVGFGYPIATASFLLLTMLMLGERRWFWLVAVALGVTGALYYLFFAFLGVYPPEGLLVSTTFGL